MIYDMNLDLRTYSTFNTGGIAHKVFEIKEKEDIKKVTSYCEYIHKPLVIIGEGSNSIFSDTTDKYVIGLMCIPGIEILSQVENSVFIKAYAGELWDTVVSWSVEHELSGLEALSGIPGKAGAAPIQNIGAYGSDISKSFVEAEVFDRKTKSFVTLIHDQCEFGYRESVFKKEKDRYIIVSITLKLSTIQAIIPQYKDVQDFFISNPNPSTKEIRDAIIQIRNSKIPDYKKVPNCGSFFKNPIITKTHLEKIKEKFEDIPSFEISYDMYKVFAGWLIEHVDYASAQTGGIVFNETNKLVLLNTDATFDDLQNTLSKITKLVQEAYDITLEIEPNIFS
jgi:UDP-N-acetylmuramate dehydrogenase